MSDLLSKPLSEDERFMAAALDLGRRDLGQTWPNPAVGALIVAHRDGEPVIVGRGWTQRGGRPHAEAVALAEAGDAAFGATIYVTLEPCSHQGRAGPCADAIIAAGIRRVVSAIEDPDERVKGDGHAKLRAAGIATTLGVMAEEATRAHRGHITRVLLGRPYILVKLALSADEKVGLAGPSPLAITGPEAAAHVHMMRAESDAIMVGVGTVIADDPQLTCRLPGMEDRSPVRIVADSSLRIPLASRLVRTARSVPLWVLTSPGASPERERLLADAGVEVIRVPVGVQGRLDLNTAMQSLGGRGITRLMVEGGPTLVADLLVNNLVDDMALLKSPVVVGEAGIAAFSEPADKLLSRCGFQPQDDAITLGRDTLFRYSRM